jgi:hypothetical protein
MFTKMSDQRCNFIEQGINLTDSLFKVIRNEKPGNNRKSCLCQ